MNISKNNIKINFKIKNCFSLLYQLLCESKIFWWKLTQYRKKFIISNLDVDDTSWQKCYRNSDYFFFVWEGSHLRQTERITNWDWKKDLYVDISPYKRNACGLMHSKLFFVCSVKIYIERQALTLCAILVLTRLGGLDLSRHGLDRDSRSRHF